MSQWILMTSPHAAELSPSLTGREISLTVTSGGTMRVGDTVYLWRLGHDDLYGWGVVSTDPTESVDAGQVQVKVRVAVLFGEHRTLNRARLPHSGAMDKVRASGGNEQLDPIEVPDNEAEAINVLIRNEGFGAPVNPTATPSEKMNLDFDSRMADALYRPFPNFSLWHTLTVNSTRWDRYNEALKEISNNTTPEQLERSLEVVKRAAALDTGAIEGLYDTDRSFTITVATQAALWQTAMSEKGPHVAALFESQLGAYNHVLDLATRNVPIAEAWIRELHREICKAQDTYRAWTELGWQNLRLPRGEYKILPNHVLTEGGIHAYAPVDMTPTEMHRLCNEIRGEAFEQAHPLLQASYAHYALVSIHPFADGNGRVARALASVFTYRSSNVPLLILSENRGDYLKALRAADRGDLQPFLDFTLDRALDAAQLAHDGLIAALEHPPPAESVERIRSLYVTTGGYEHSQVDNAGERLLMLFRKRLLEGLKAHAPDEVTVSTSFSSVQTYDPGSPALRIPRSNLQRRFQLTIQTREPAEARVEMDFGVGVPRDCGLNDDLVIRDLSRGTMFRARADLLIPEEKGFLEMIISVWIEGVIAKALKELREKAESSERAKYPSS